MAQSDGPDEPATQRWVSEELQALRGEMAAGLRTSRVQVGDRGGAHVLITARDGAAVVQVVDPTGSVAVELIAVSDDDGPHRAGLELIRDGDGHASLLVIKTADGVDGRCELVFDDPTGSGRWTVIDRGGPHVADR